MVDYILLVAGLLGLCISIFMLKCLNRSEKIMWKPQTCSKNALLEIQEECRKEKERWLKLVLGIKS